MVDKEFIRKMKRESLEQKKIKYNDSGFGDKYRSSVLFDDTVVNEGGWYCGRKWMTAKQLDRAETRWVKHSYTTGEAQPDFEGWIAHQCGGCRWFAALDCDYGICCNETSPNDGRITFEHGGCIAHSDYEGEAGL